MVNSFGQINRRADRVRLCNLSAPERRGLALRVGRRRRVQAPGGGWSTSASMTAQLVADALLVAVWRRGRPDALIHHTDQARHYYSSEQFQSDEMGRFFSSLTIGRTARVVPTPCRNR
jgi:transposase InsO family protein